MPDITVNVEVYCATCGEGLCNQTEFAQTRYRNEPSLRVEACQRCLDKAYDEGYGKGYDDAESKD